MTSAAWPWLGYLIGFGAMLLIAALVIIITNLRVWHDAFHTRRNINRAFSCDHCSRKWLGR